MKEINYKVGDIVALVDGVHYKYRGKNRKEEYYVYDPVLPNMLSVFYTLPEEDCVKYGYNIGAVPFFCKMYTNVTKV